MDKSLVNVDSVITDLKKIVGIEKVESLLNQGDRFEELLFEAELTNDDSDKIREDLDELIYHLKKEYIKDDLEKVFGELKSAEEKGDSEKISKKLKKYKELSDELANINTK